MADGTLVRLFLDMRSLVYIFSVLSSSSSFSLTLIFWTFNESIEACIFLDLTRSIRQISRDIQNHASGHYSSSIHFE